MSSKPPVSLKHKLATYGLLFALPFIILFGIIRTILGPKLNKEEADSLFKIEIEKLISLGHAEILEKIRQHADLECEEEPSHWYYNITADSGVEYQIAFQGTQKDPRSEITIYGSISNGGPSVFHYHKELFRIEPDGAVIRKYDTV